MNSSILGLAKGDLLYPVGETFQAWTLVRCAQRLRICVMTKNRLNLLCVR